MAQDNIPSSQQYIELRKNLIQSFDAEELRLLCSDIGIDFENLGGDGKEAIANRLIAYLNRRGNITTLIEKLNKERPNVNWRKLLVVEPTPLPEVQLGTRRHRFRRMNVVWFLSVLITLIIGIAVGLFTSKYGTLLFKDSSFLPNNQIRFESLSEPGKLDSYLKWISGEGTANFYKIDEKPLIIHAGNETNQYADKNTAPLIIYPCRGDFIAQVAVDFEPSQKYQVAGIGVRSAQTNYSWVRISREINDDGSVIAFTVNRQGQPIDYNSHPFTSNQVYLRAERRGQKFFLSYSPDGNTWSLIGVPETDYPPDVEIFLVTLSTDNNQEVSAKFSDFTVSQKR